MGSISYSIDRDTKPKAEVLDYLTANLQRTAEIVDHSFGPGDGYRGSFTWGGVLYAAVRTLRPNGEPEVSMFLLMFSTRSDGGSRQIVIKTSHEDEGPYYDGPAQRLMKLLTATDNKYSNQWREKVTEGHQRQRVGRGRARTAQGRTIRLARPLTYGAGIGDVSEVTVIDMKTWRDNRSGRRLRPPPKWMCLDFDILGEPA